MLHSMLSAPRAPQRPAARLWAALAVASITPAAALAAALPAPPQTFDSSYVAPTGSRINVVAGENLQAVLNNAKPGETIVLPAGATFRGPFTLPKIVGSGWIYVVSSHLANLPPPGTRVSPANAANMPKILAPNGVNALNTVVINAVSTTATFNTPTGMALQNNQYNSDGSINPTRLQPKSAGLGAATGAQTMRNLQLQLRFQF